MRAAVKSRVVEEIKVWAHLGLISDALARQLALPHEMQNERSKSLRQWLSFVAVYFLGTGVFGLFALANRNLWVSVLLCGAAAATMWLAGARLSVHPAQRRPYAGSVMLTIGLLLGYVTLSLLYLAAGGSDHSDVFPAFMLLIGGAALATAYEYRLRWPLLLGVMLIFHGLGSWHGYAGHGMYVMDIQDPRMMAVAGVAAVILGLWHETVLESAQLRRHVGFGHVYLIAGLLYVNLSLWVLSLVGGVDNVGWVLVFTLAGIGQLVAGARLKDSRITGFGVVFLSIDLYTRFFEHFWNHLSAATFFLVAGILGMLIGYACERHGAGPTREGPALQQGSAA